MNTGGPDRLSRRDFLKGAGLAAVAAFAPQIPEGLASEMAARNHPFEYGKYQTHPYLWTGEGKVMKPVFQDVDVGTLGPDVDTIFGFDFMGDIPTGALKIYAPSGEAEVTRVVGIKRAVGLETVQFNKVLGGDRFDVYKISEYGGDAALDAMARKHAENTAHTHQKVVYVGDLAGFQNQFGQKEQELLNRIIRAQRPGRPDLGIPESNFVRPRIF